MQFIFSDPYYDSEDWDENRYLGEIKELVLPLDTDSIVESSNIGHGADFPGVLVDIFNNVDWKIITGGTVAGAFLLGDKINKNLGAWVSIFKKTAQLIEKIKPSRIDEQTALVIALNSIVSKGHDIQRVEVSMQLVPFSKGACSSEFRLESTPDALYIITIKTNDKVFVFGIKSTSKIEFLHEFSTDWYDF